jgi:hypothetical protein
LTDEHGLRLFPFPGRDAAFAALQHALLWTFQEFSLARLRSGRRRAGPASQAEHPDGSLPHLHTVKGVLGYREAVQREFVRSVALGTHVQKALATGASSVPMAIVVFEKMTKALTTRDRSGTRS